MSVNKLKVAIVTGPTGGHFFPGLAIGEELEGKGNADVSFFVPRREYLIRWLEKKGFEYKAVPEVRITLKNILSPFKFVRLFFRAVIFLSEGRFDGLVVTGSYTTVPFLLAARLLNKKIFVHEQNFLPGKVTKLSVFIADRIALSFPHFAALPKRKTAVTGFPIASDFKRKFSAEELLGEFGFSEENKTVLVLGGSQGASFINRLMAENMEYLEGKNLQFIHLAGKEKEKLEGDYERRKVKAKVFDFYYDMAKLYNIADIAVCRAGGGTLAEISEWRIPAVVVPYPHAGAHQKHNAAYFAGRGGCSMLEQSEKSIKNFPAVFEKTLKDFEAIKRNLEKCSISDSEGATAGQILGLLKNEKKHS
ncbi:MAG: UDP-N-acetylglucosamine--N-acetylmuramyl-(pentapeptide) pyrophosphoryl-undecaprenol N-acetylglucosamine transferase [Candidatus Omnitrophica bacterium]|nr:UDP-N-acetylglucosamine--N-acetylmuramyl-(pentapeptide) pyrophosphoryl-undecaprenol N-acetylglucosamine transferase [Candidatus Omnitrophota bacterium]